MSIQQPQLHQGPMFGTLIHAAMMRDFLLTDSERAFRVELRDFLASELLPCGRAIENDDDWDAVRRVVRAVGEAGYLKG